MDNHTSTMTYGKDQFVCNNASEIMDENALNRVASLPMVASTWNALQNYYAGMKKKYPGVSPYLEVAENFTTTAANIALNKSKPVVDKFGPTVNSYANKGLDTLEEKVPIITKQPEEIYATTRSKASDIISNKVNDALDATEKYVDYYLPGDEEEEEKMLKMQEVSFDEDESMETSSDTDESENEDEEEIDEIQPTPTERIRNISNKVRQRSYRKAMKKLQGVQVRSREALNRLRFTVDLIQYAQDTINSSSMVAAANDKMLNGMTVTLDGLQYAADSVNKQVEERVLVRARNLSRQLNMSCRSALNYVQNSPKLHPLLEQARKAKEATEDLYSAFAGKTSISELSSAVIESTRPKIKLVEETLLRILEHLADQPPISWLAPELDIDPLDGMDMGEIEAQLYGRPLRENNEVQTRRPSPKRQQG